MEQNGRLTARVYTAGEAIPLSGATVVVTQRNPSGRVRLLGLRRSNENGQTEAVTVETPALELSQTPTGEVSWASCDVTVDHPRFGRIIVEDVQVFPGVETLQEFALTPLEEIPEQWGETFVFNVTPQEL